MKKEIITEFLHDNKIVILGFGKEGISSYRFIRKHFPDMPLVVADRNRALDISKYSDDEHLSFILGEDYDNNLNDFDLILKTPGVNLNHLSYFIPLKDLFSTTFYKRIWRPNYRGYRTKREKYDLFINLLYLKECYR